MDGGSEREREREGCEDADLGEKKKRFVRKFKQKKNKTCRKNVTKLTCSYRLNTYL